MGVSVIIGGKNMMRELNNKIHVLNRMHSTMHHPHVTALTETHPWTETPPCEQNLTDRCKNINNNSNIFKLAESCHGHVLVLLSVDDAIGDFRRHHQIGRRGTTLQGW